MVEYAMLQHAKLHNGLSNINHPYHRKHIKPDTRHIAYPRNRAGPCFNSFSL